MTRIHSSTTKGYGPTSRFDTQFQGSVTEEVRRQCYDFLEDSMRRAVLARLGSVPPLEELAGRMCRYIAPDHRNQVIALDHQPLLHIEWWPCPSSTEHISSILKVTPMQPDSTLPFPIAEL